MSQHRAGALIRNEALTMRKPTTVPCTVTWCDSSTHPADQPNRHYAHVATFPVTTDASDIEIVLLQAAPDNYPMEPHIALRRTLGTLWAQLDMTPGEALILAEMFAALDPTDLVRIAAALAAAATTLAAADPEADQ